MLFSLLSPVSFSWELCLLLLYSSFLTVFLSPLLAFYEERKFIEIIWNASHRCSPLSIPLWACIPISEETPQISYKYTFFHTAANSNSNFILLCIFMNLFCFLYHYSHSDIIRTWCRQPAAPHSKLPDTLGPCLGIFPGRQAGRRQYSMAVPAPAQLLLLLSPSVQPQEVVVLPGISPGWCPTPPAFQRAH